MKRGFSHLPEIRYETVIDQCTKRLEEFFNKQRKEHRIEYISMLNYLIENFPFGNHLKLILNRNFLFEFIQVWLVYSKLRIQVTISITRKYLLFDSFLVCDQLITIGEELWSDVK